MTCDVYLTPHALDLLARHNFTDFDKKVLVARLQDDPLVGRIIDHKFPAVRALKHSAAKAETRKRRREKNEIFYAFFPNSDVQLHGKDVVIVLGIATSSSLSGTGLEPESVLRPLEVLAELTRYVIG
jgi:hypothetical protein